MCHDIINADIVYCAVLGRIHSESWKAAYKNIIPSRILDNMSAEASKNKFYKEIMKGSENISLILRDDEFVGYICLDEIKDIDALTGEIESIYITPSFWRQGLGTELIEWAISTFIAKKYDRISLWVFEDNNDARRFFEKFGFRHDGTIKELNLGKPINQYRYTMDISRKPAI